MSNDPFKISIFGVAGGVAHSFLIGMMYLYISNVDSVSGEGGLGMVFGIVVLDFPLSFLFGLILYHFESVRSLIWP